MTANINIHNTARYTTSRHVQVLFTMFCFALLLLLAIQVSIKRVVASAHAQLFLLVITVGNTFPLVVTVGNTCPRVITVRNTFPLVATVRSTFPLFVTVRNTFPLVITVGNTFLLVITVGNKLPLVITVENTFPPLITVGKNNGSSFFLKKRGTFEMSSVGHRTNKTGENFNLAKIFLNMRVRL